MTTAPTTTPKPRRRWLQYSLRTLLVLMLVLGCGLGWFAHKVQRARAQRKAAAAIKAVGGRLLYAPVSGAGVRTAVAWVGKLLDEELSGDVIGGDLAETLITDAGLEHLWGLTQLRALSLAGAQVTDAGLGHLRGLTQLRELYLANTPVSDAGLVHLRGLRQLVVLYLDNTHVTDAGLEHLRGLTELQTLGLNNTQVSDAGLVHLRGLTQPSWLDLSSTQVTGAGVAELQKALPNCKLIR
jgi:hypothetical protein